MMLKPISFMRKASGGGGGSTVTASLTDSHYEGKTDTTHTSRSVSGLSVPNAAAGRGILVIGVIRAYNTAWPDAESFTVNIGGSAADYQAGLVENITSGHAYLAFAGISTIATGTTVDFEITWPTTSVDFSRLWLGVYEVTDWDGNDFHDSVTVFQNSATFTNPLGVEEGGAVFAAAYNDNSTTGATGVSSDATDTGNGDGQIVGSADELSADASFDAVFTISSAGNGGSIAVSLGPS